MGVLQNPVLRGFHPDPSICQKGDKYYLATSTFEFFPSVPIFQSTDLANWQQIGFCITDPSIINLNGCPSGKGIYAPTLRYNPHDDTFYMITVLCHSENYFENEVFFVSAKNPAGPWSKKTIVYGAEGIDPSLFFENDKAYYVGNLRPEPTIKSSCRHIWIDEIDLKTGELAGKRTVLLTDGAVHDARCPEGPHIYSFGNYYYLLIAEGGTALDHAISVFRSECIWGPYENNPRNPVLTHRNLGRNSEFNSIGHADIIQTDDGSFWTVLLGVRPYGGEPCLRNLGRETFVAPIVWENDWPVFCPESGKVEKQYILPWETKQIPVTGFTDFQTNKLELFWEMLRTPCTPIYRLGPHGLYLLLNKYTLYDNGACAFLGRRQQEALFLVETLMEFTPKERNESAGLAIMLHSHSFYLLEKIREGSQDILRLSFAGHILYSALSPQGPLPIRAAASALDYWFEIRDEHGIWQRFGDTLDGRELSRVEQGYTGVMIGLYASSNGEESKNEALFHYFSYRDWK